MSLAKNATGITVKLDWRGDQYLAAIRKGAAKGARTVGRMLVTKVKQNLSGPAGSPPGGPPGRVDGELIAAVKSKVTARGNRLSVRIGILNDTGQMAKGARLAGGYVGRDRDGRFYSQEPRPWLDPIIVENADEITREILSGIDIGRGGSGVIP